MNAFTTVATIPPAVVITYIGTGSSYYERLQEISARNKGGLGRGSTTSDSAPTSASAVAGSENASATNGGLFVATPFRPGSWVAVQHLGSPRLFFDHLVPKGKKDRVDAGDVLKANRNINIRPAPADWAHKLKILPRNAVVAVAETWTFESARGATQTWARVDLVD